MWEKEENLFLMFNFNIYVYVKVSYFLVFIGNPITSLDVAILQIRITQVYLWGNVYLWL